MANLDIQITKAANAIITVDTDSLPEEIYREALLRGLKDILNHGPGVSKLTKANYGDDKAAMQKKAMETAQAVAEDIVKKDGDGHYNGDLVRLTGQKKAKAKASGAVMTEARRLARNLVKQAIKDAGGKISHYESKDITAAANEILGGEQGPELIKMAEENLAKRVTASTDIASLLKPSAKKVKQAEEKAERAKAEVSAAAAGKVQVRAKPAGATAH